MSSPEHSQWWHLSILEAPQGSGSTRRGHLSSLPGIIHFNLNFPFLTPSSHMCFPSHIILNTYFSDRCCRSKALLFLVKHGRGSLTYNPPHTEPSPLVSENDFLFFKLHSWLVFKMFSERKSTSRPFTQKSCQSIDADLPGAIEEAAKL